MLNFNFYSPTEFVFGRGTEEQTGKLCKEYGAKRVLIVYGGGSAVRSGLLSRVESSLDAEGISHCSLSGVRPNPTDLKVYEGLELAKKEQIDFLLAVGGGSVIDTAKAIAAGICYDGDFWDLYIGRGKCTKALPVGVVLTIPAAGSEGSGNTVITKESTQQKLGLREPKWLRPRFAVMNPELTMTLPEWQTASGICDMMIHIIERYLTNTPDVEMTDRTCEGFLIGIMRSAERLMQDPQNYAERANIMWAGTVAHNGVCGVGREEDWTSHAIEHEISALYDVTHGAGLAVVTPAFMEYALEENPAKIAQLAQRVMGVKTSSEDVMALPLYEQKAVALEGTRRLRTWFHDVLHLPVTMRQLGIDNPDIDRMVEGLHRNKGAVTGFYVKLDHVASRKIYEMTL